MLARVRAFLPDFQASTAELVKQASVNPEAVNVERVRKGESAIAMDLGLGVYDAPGVAGKEGDVQGLGPVVDSSAAGMEQDSDGSDVEEDDGDEGLSASREDESDSSDSTSDNSSEDSDNAPSDEVSSKPISS